MKLATYHHGATTQVGVVVGDRIYDLAKCLAATDGDVTIAASTLAFLAGGDAAVAAAQSAIEHVQDDPALVQPLSAVKLAAPIPCPGKLLCLAGNYAAHIEEGGRTYVGKEKMIPRFFSKPCSTVIATGEAIRVPASTGFADWELELAVVIGKSGRDLTAEQAKDYIAGYTIFNDISLNDEVPHPDQLAMKLWLNGELQQDANTGQMIFSPAEAIAFISQFVTLNPGDVISTGTPAGVGSSKKLRLNPGDRIRGEIEGLGVLENTVEAW